MLIWQEEQNLHKNILYLWRILFSQKEKVNRGADRDTQIRKCFLIIVRICATVRIWSYAFIEMGQAHHKSLQQRNGFCLINTSITVLWGKVRTLGESLGSKSIKELAKICTWEMRASTHFCVLCEEKDNKEKGKEQQLYCMKLMLEARENSQYNIPQETGCEKKH